MSKGTRYTDDFKKQIVALYKSGKQVSKLSREYDVATPTIYKWINEFKKLN
jgi:transposase